MSEDSPPKARLRETQRGQNIIVGAAVLATAVFFGAIVAAFFIGQSLADAPVTSEPEVALEFEPPEIIFPSLTGGPQSPGSRDWDELRGGECLASFDDGAFAEVFDVTECSNPHEAQLVKAQLMSRDRTETFPGEAQILVAVKEICDVVDLIDTDYVKEFTDLVVEASYPVDSTQWDEGQRVVYCFMRSSGGTKFDATVLL